MSDNQNKKWTKREERLLKKLWKTESKDDIASELGRTVQAIVSRAASLGLPGQHQPSSGPTATKNRIMKAIRRRSSTIQGIADDIDVPRTLVHQHILDLERQGLVRRTGLGKRPQGRGRAPTLWKCA